MNTKKIAILAVMSAISIILAFSLHLPIFPIAPFLEYDPADIPIILCTFLYGPGTGIFLTFVVSVLQGVTISSQSGIIGIFMHIVATGSMVLVSGFLFKYLGKTKIKTLPNIIISTVCGVLTWLGTMILWNILITPIFLNVPREAVYQLMLPAILPFNIIKPTVNAVLACLLYFALRNSIKNLNSGTELPNNSFDNSDKTYDESSKNDDYEK